MKHILIFFVFGFTFSLLLLGCATKDDKPQFPQPTDTIITNPRMENGEHRDLKKHWFEAIHRAEPETNWRLIERENAFAKYELLQAQSNIKNRNLLKIIIDGGALVANWQEKGSINQAGSMLKTAYNHFNDKLYAISDGGSIWKSNIAQHDWEVVNQDLRFDGRFLDIVYPEDLDYRIITSIGGLPHYLDANSEFWFKAAGFDNSTFATIKDQFIIDNGRNVFYLSQANKNSKVQVFYSSDYGRSYQIIKTLNSNKLTKCALSSAKNSNDLFLIEQKEFIKAEVSKFNFQNNKLEIITSNSPISFGDDELVNLETAVVNRQLVLYSYDHQNRFYKSENQGRTWNIIAALPTTPWEAGIQVSPSNPKIVMLGAVEAYRSINGGRTWDIVNEWDEYNEDNQSTTLHADIMFISEFDTKNEGAVMLVSNHGGISKSYDLGDDFINMGLRNLNVSQYYSVRTYPYDNDYIFAGSQDQGLQRSLDLNEGPVHFTQFISGDFGHLQFTNLGKSLWAIYPGGWINYYADPVNKSEMLEFDLETENKSIWMPPIITSPYDPNTILIAGGSLRGTSGSHIVQLTIDDFSQFFGTQWPYNFFEKSAGGDISALAYNKSNNNEFYVLTTNGKFFKSTNKGLSFTEKKAGLSGAHEMYGNTILSSAKHAKNVIIGGSGYSNPAVYFSSDFGESFSPMIEGLPPTSVFEMTYNNDEQFIFAATEAGPYVYSMEKKRWFDLAQGKAPNQRYWSVEYLEEGNKVRYGTYGRGIWDLVISESSAEKNLTQESKISIFPNPSENVFHVKSNLGAGRITVRNAEGKLIFIKEILAGEDFNFDLSGFSNGLYYVIFDDRNTKSSNIIVKI